MGCQETREKLSALADSELGEQELERVRGHLAGCPACRRDLQEQGVLDMLLKSCFELEPPEVTLDGIWPSVSERIEGGDGSKPGNGGGTVRDGGDIVFKSSSAMQMLRIPEVAAPSTAVAPAAAPAPRSSWAWPAAVVVSSAILAGGFLLYKKMTPAAGPDAAGQVAVATAAASPDSGANAAAAPASRESESASASQPAATASTAASQEPSAAHTAPAAVASAEHKGGARVAKHAAKGTKVAAAAPAKANEPPAEEKKPEAKAEPPKPARKGSDDLDNLIDDAIGGPVTPKKAKKEEAPKAPAEDIPEQLTMNQIRTAMNKVKGHVQACYDKYQIEGEARISFTINPDGSVGDCSIKGKFFGTDTGTCVVAAVKKAHFPKFSGRAIAIPNYPFMLQ